MPTMQKGSKVEISYFSWIMGGPLLSVSTSNSSSNGKTRERRRSSRRSVTISEEDDDDKEVPASRGHGKEKRIGADDGMGHKKNTHGREGNDEKSNEKNTGSGGWTTEQDKQITGMKSANKSWKQIAMVVGASRKDVQKRYKELQTSELAHGNDGYGEHHLGGGHGSRGAEEVFGGLEGLAGVFENIEDAAGNAVDGGGGGGEKMQNSGGKQNGNVVGKTKTRGGGNEKQKEPMGGKLTADDIWTRDDCEVLEMLEARYTEHKWLHLQAGFFNWTGRMVAGEIIEKKFRDDGAA